jgi:hypothetical protein
VLPSVLEEIKVLQESLLSAKQKTATIENTYQDNLKKIEAQRVLSFLAIVHL